MSGEVVRPGIGHSVVEHERRIRALERSRPNILAAGAATYPDGVHSLSDIVAYWPLTDGASPFADESGIVPAEPMGVGGGGVSMNQDFTPGPLATGDEGAVEFLGGPAAGQFLLGSGGTLGRFNLTGDISIAAWIRPLANASAFNGTVLGHADAGFFGIEGWETYMAWPSRELFWLRRETGSPAQSTNFSGGVLPAAEWSHVVVTHDSTDAMPDSIFYNGLLAATADGSLVTSMPTSNAHPTIGVGILNAGGTPSYFYGGVAHVAVWNRPLTPEEALYLFLSGNVPGADLVVVSDGTGGFTLAPPRTVYLNGG